MSGTGDLLVQTTTVDDRLKAIESAIPSPGTTSTLILLDSWTGVADLFTILEATSSTPGCVMKCTSSTTPEELRVISAKSSVTLITHPLHFADRLAKKQLKRSHFKTIILVDLNEILDRGCRDQVQDLLLRDARDVQALEDTRIVITCSTPSNDVLSFKKHLKNPQIKLKPSQSPSLARVDSFYINYKQNGWKINKLLELLKTNGDEPTVIVCNSRRTVERLAEELQQAAGVQANTIHADLDPRDRADVVTMFLSGITQYLITTELAFSSVSGDIQNSLIINYDLPVSKEKYLSRVGGGAGKTVINFMVDDDARLLRDIERHCGTRIEEMIGNVVAM